MNIWKEEGSDNSYWIGTIIKCKFNKWHTNHKQGYDDRRCPNEECLGYCSSSSGKFCHHCGAEIVSKPTYYDELIKPDKDLPELPQGLELKLWDEYYVEKEDLEYIIYGAGNCGDCDRYSTNKEYSPEDIQKEIDDLKKKYKDYIAKCEKVFGKENVTVAWGIFSYYDDY